MLEFVTQPIILISLSAGTLSVFAFWALLVFPMPTVVNVSAWIGGFVGAICVGVLLPAFVAAHGALVAYASIALAAIGGGVVGTFLLYYVINVAWAVFSMIGDWLWTTRLRLTRKT